MIFKSWFYGKGTYFRKNISLYLNKSQYFVLSEMFSIDQLV